MIEQRLVTQFLAMSVDSEHNLHELPEKKIENQISKVLWSNWRLQVLSKTIEKVAIKYENIFGVGEREKKNYVHR